MQYPATNGISPAAQEPTASALFQQKQLLTGTIDKTKANFTSKSDACLHLHFDGMQTCQVRMPCGV